MKVPVCALRIQTDIVQRIENKPTWEVQLIHLVVYCRVWLSVLLHVVLLYYVYTMLSHDDLTQVRFVRARTRVCVRAYACAHVRVCVCE